MIINVNNFKWGIEKKYDIIKGKYEDFEILINGPIYSGSGYYSYEYDIIFGNFGGCCNRGKYFLGKRTNEGYDKMISCIKEETVNKLISIVNQMYEQINLGE